MKVADLLQMFVENIATIYNNNWSLDKDIPIIAYGDGVLRYNNKPCEPFTRPGNEYHDGKPRHGCLEDVEGWVNMNVCYITYDANEEHFKVVGL